MHKFHLEDVESVSFLLSDQVSHGHRVVNLSTTCEHTDDVDVGVFLGEQAHVILSVDASVVFRCWIELIREKHLLTVLNLAMSRPKTDYEVLLGLRLIILSMFSSSLYYLAETCPLMLVLLLSRLIVQHEEVLMKVAVFNFVSLRIIEASEFEIVHLEQFLHFIDFLWSRVQVLHFLVANEGLLGLGNLMTSIVVANSDSKEYLLVWNECG